ncbi:hypothetical protein [uncultured Friedmanniella sp.]
MHVETMQSLLDHLDDQFGGSRPFSPRHGWTADDTRRLRVKLLG